MRKASILFLAVLALSAKPILLFFDDPLHVLPPAISADGNLVLFAAATSPEGTSLKSTNLFAFSGERLGGTIRQLTNYSGGTSASGVSSLTYPGSGGNAAFTTIPPATNAEEVHVINVTTGADKTIATDREGCVQILLTCVNCSRACVGPVHLTPDGSRVLYAVARERPFFVLNADGTGVNRLPVFYGVLATQRVISRDGTFVFTSNTPNGPTLGATATDIYSINLDGTGMKNVTRFRDAMFYATEATVSLDGSLIAFVSNYSESGPQQSSQVWVIRSDGTGLTRRSFGSEVAGEPSISGDGLVLTYVQGGQLVRLLTRPDSSSVLPLTTLSFSAASSPVLSEDGRRVAFNLSHSTGLPAAVYRTPADSTSTFDQFTKVFAPRVISSSGVVSAAGRTRPSPGSLITAYGANLGAEELAQANSFPLPTTLGGVSLLVDGQPVPLLAVTPWQINAQLPQTTTISGAGLQFQLRHSGGTTPAITIEPREHAAENFLYSVTRGGSNYFQAAAFHAGTAVPADLDHPAAAGETLEFYMLGLGVTQPMVAAGIPSPVAPLARARLTPRIWIGDREATVTFAGLVPGLAGVYQANVIVPSGLPSGLNYIEWETIDGRPRNSSIALK